MNLKQKDSGVLVSELKTLVARERETTLQIIYYLREVEARRIYLEEGYPSLYEWSVGELKYSTGEAYRRIQAMRLLQVLPELSTPIQSGELSITNASQAQTAFKKEDQKRKARCEKPLTRQEKKDITDSLMNTSTREAENKLGQVFPDQKKYKKITLELSPELEAKLDELKNLLAKGTPEALIEKLADLALERLRAKKIPAPEKNPHLGKPGPAFITAPEEPLPIPKNRHIPDALKNAVRLRDQNRCTYRARATGKLCGSSYQIEFEHLLPYAFGGAHSLENLTLRCRAHNQHAARKQGFTPPFCETSKAPSLRAPIR
jgi:hypothetical protein